VSLTINLEARGAGSAYAADNLPEADPFWLASGYSSSLVVTSNEETVTYTPADSGHKGVTIWAYAAGNVYKINGARCNPVIPMTPGALGILRFEIQGWMTTAPSVAAVPAITYSAAVPIPSVGTATLVFGGWTPDIISAEWNGGNVITRSDSVNKANGIAGFDISEHNPILSLSAKAVALATFDPYARRAAKTTNTISLVYGSMQYNKMTLASSNSYLTGSPVHEDQDGFAGWGLESQIADLTVLYD
jgi:hypothetical protein